MNSWYLLDESTGTPRPSGPFTLDELRAMAASGALRGESLVAAVGASGWGPAAREPLLAALFGAMPPVSPGIAPGWAASASNAAGGAGTVAYSFAAAFELAWSSFKARWVWCLVFSLVWMGISIAIAVPQNITTIAGQGMERSGQGEEGAALLLVGSCLGIILQVLVGMPLLAGGFYAGGRLIEGEERLGNLFQGFRHYGAALGSGVLLLLVYIGCVMVAFMPFVAASFLGSVGGAGGVGPALVIGFAFSVGIAIALLATVVMRVLCAPTIAIDPAFGHPGIIESFRLSWSHTAGLGFSMLGLLIVAGILAALTILLLCVGYFLIGLPLLFAVTGAMYLMVHRRHADARAVYMRSGAEMP